jgi:hypothetical protein
MDTGGGRVSTKPRPCECLTIRYRGAARAIGIHCEGPGSLPWNKAPTVGDADLARSEGEGEMTGQRPSETKRSAAVASNSLLASLPRTAFAALEPHLTEVSLPKGAILQRISDGPDGIHFPTDGIASFQSIMKDGTAIDTAIDGHRWS